MLKRIAVTIVTSIFCSLVLQISVAAPHAVTLSGGAGSCFRKAVIVNARLADAKAAIAAEREYLVHHFGSWKSTDSEVIMRDAHFYHVVVLVTDEHKKHTLYFDISCCWAAMMTLKSI
jgi:hypothetical protein